ncbi:MAG TPA: substrate-binding domain-containing protein [Aestuariivirgaceae bacterium]|jgi:tungstate transport system substrate-binding protein
MLRRAFILALIASMTAVAAAQERTLTLASTTSTEQSGFFAYVLPLFQAETGIRVNVVAVGTGQALKIGERGDADALLVHDPAGEEKFVSAGHGVDRRPVMFNDFIIVGPVSDPAGVKGSGSAKEAFSKMADAKAAFVSRGDDSGTHRMELRQWKAAGVEAQGDWYRETGQGMGPTLNIAAELNAYVLTDRATWANFKNRGKLDVSFQHDPALFNPYSSILVNPSKSSNIRSDEAKAWHEWITASPGRKAIVDFKIDGEQVFFLPDAKLSN